MATIEKSIEVNVPARVAYEKWTRFEEFPKFMEGVQEVKRLDSNHLQWKAEFGGKIEEWSAEIDEEITNKRIAWHSTSGAENDGIVTFSAISPGRTAVKLHLEYDPEGLLENIDDKLRFVTHRIAGDLERFKEIVESRGLE